MIQPTLELFYPTAFKKRVYSRYKEHRVEHKVINKLKQENTMLGLKLCL